jgi:hypothetical protein
VSAARRGRRDPGPVARAQVWIELRSADPAAVSAFDVAHTRLAAGRRLQSLRRLRLIELAGDLPDPGALEALLHRSSRFYNPHKEHAAVRTRESDPAPRATDAVALLVVERGEDRSAASERWWRHETGAMVEVREAVVWMLSFEPGEDAAARSRELAALEDRGRGLFANPASQDWTLTAEVPPLAWIESTVAAAGEPA